MKRNVAFQLMAVLVAASMLLSACGPAPTPVVVEKERVVEKPVVQTVVVEKEKIVEKPVVQTVVVEKVVEKEVTPAAPVEFVFAHPGPIRTMDAPVTWYGSTHWLTNLLYDCLIWRNADGSGFHGQAAEKWGTINPTTWRFHLRKGNTFQNGEPLDAHAVKWNIDRVRTRTDFMVQPQWLFVKDVIVVDDWTVDITTAEPYAYFEGDVSYNGCQLLPPKYLAQVGEEEFARKPIGSGPYRLVKFIASERYEFEAWDGYWAGRPEVDRVIYQVVPEEASRIAALLAGQVDLVATVPLPDREKVCKASGVKCTTMTSGRGQNIFLRTETESGTPGIKEKYPGYQPTTMDKRIRQALSHALNRTVLAEIQGSGYPTLVRIGRDNPEVSTFADRLVGPAVCDRWYDPELAKKLIKEAGYDPDAGEKPVIHLDAPAHLHGNEKEVAEAVAIMWEEVGFEVKLNILERSAFLEQVHEPGLNREATLEVLGTVASGLSPLFYTCEYWSRIYHYCFPDWDALSKQIVVEVDSEKRLKLWEKFWDYYLDEAVTLSLLEIDNVYAISDQFEWMPRVDGWMTFRDLKIKK